ncbi:YybH family protein [Williamsia sterculiae]|uniref:SnoaL-like domain-containing protein n=1 Tax=Williamsia sterculiae TaxID=1344003 RepID=A0A1N7GY59_9NOCA|nr:nuclear transport factor 2 family protein [Williamsia sterculiae]SIS17456.1 conserved hypothetical protein [Williamsia sterculiae]
MSENSTSTGPETLNDRWCAAFNAGDITRLMTMYEEDAVIVPGPGADPVVGHQAIETALRGFVAMGGTLHFSPRHWLVTGDLALGSAAFVMDGGHDADGVPVGLHGVTAELVRRQTDGSWKYVIDHPFGGAG